jgi:hypothetical protein
MAISVLSVTAAVLIGFFVSVFLLCWGRRAKDCRCPLPPTQHPRAAPSAPSVTAPTYVGGEVVELCGLVRALQLNGKIGILRAFDTTTRRWAVELERDGSVVGVAAEHFRVAVETAVQLRARLTRAASRASLASGCPICLEPLDSTGLSGLHRFGCGHFVHSACWEAHTLAHAPQYAADSYDAAPTIRRCPVCNAWDGVRGIRGLAHTQPPTAASPTGPQTRMPTCAAPLRCDAKNYLFKCMGYVYRSRWQAAGQDKSAESEFMFIDECFLRAKATGHLEAAVSSLDATLAAFRSEFNPSSWKVLYRQQDLLTIFGPLLKAYVRSIIPFFTIPTQQRRGSGRGFRRPAQLLADAQEREALLLFLPHIQQWLSSFLPVGDLLVLDPHILDELHL